MDDPNTVTPLPSPMELRHALPLTARGRQTVERARGLLQRRLAHGEGPRVAIVGPCSIHDPDSALTYADRLLEIQRELGERVVCVMRAYFEKPRTRIGWKGYLYDPDLDGSDDLARGLRLSRELLVKLAERGMPTATELLEPLVAPYLDDTLSWVAIGARTTESQVHRQLAACLDVPVGFKNGTDGSVDVAVSATVAASAPHRRMGIDSGGRISLIRGRGNPAPHVVLRGGRKGPNYEAIHVCEAALAMESAGLRPALIVDCSHGNSNKDPARQPSVAREVIRQMKSGNQGLAGIMLESHLVAGRQEPAARPLTYGQSVTDACVDFAATAEVLHELGAVIDPEPRSADVARSLLAGDTIRREGQRASVTSSEAR